MAACPQGVLPSPSTPTAHTRHGEKSAPRKGRMSLGCYNTTLKGMPPFPDPRRMTPTFQGLKLFAFRIDLKSPEEWLNLTPLGRCTGSIRSFVDQARNIFFLLSNGGCLLSGLDGKPRRAIILLANRPHFPRP